MCPPDSGADEPAALTAASPTLSVHPSFRNPPVVEVALAVYFAPAVGLQSVQLGRLWDRWKGRYPRSEDQPLMPPVPQETFGTARFPLTLQFIAGQHGVRVWFITDDGDQLVQVQHDRLIHNWRRTAGRETYPRYMALRPAFVKDFKDFTVFLADEGLPPPSISQTELTYTNVIPVAALGDARDLSGLLAPLSGRYSEAFLPVPEDVRIGLRYRIDAPASGEPVGRVYVEGNPAIHSADPTAPPEEVYVLQLFARGRPLGDGLEGALAFLDLGHDWIVQGFTALTTTTMHTAWGRYDSDDG